MAAYKVIPRNSPGWRTFKAATLGVSVSSPNWQDEKFRSILEFAAQNFDAIRIDVTDSLYRHNFMAEGLDPQQAENRATALGSLWLTQHQDMIDASSIKPQVIRWAEWYKHPEYDATLWGFQQAYENSPVLREAIDGDTMEFYRRQGRNPTGLEQNHSKNYLIEELAVITLQARALSSAKIYPGDEMRCLYVVRHKLVPEAPIGLEREQFVKVKFDKRDVAAPLPARPADQLATINRIKRDAN